MLWDSKLMFSLKNCKMNWANNYFLTSSNTTIKCVLSNWSNISYLFPYLHTITSLLKILLTSHWCMSSFSPCSYRHTSNPNQNSGVQMFCVVNCTIVLNSGSISYEEHNPWYLHKTFFLFLWISWTYYLSFGPI